MNLSTIIATTTLAVGLSVNAATVYLHDVDDWAVSQSQQDWFWAPAGSWPMVLTYRPSRTPWGQVWGLWNWSSSGQGGLHLSEPSRACWILVYQFTSTNTQGPAQLVTPAYLETWSAGWLTFPTSAPATGTTWAVYVAHANGAASSLSLVSLGTGAAPNTPSAVEGFLPPL
jgi:hypothetical protein